uniref:EGF-like domain-containing protein n=1 Tax=Mesocestoides corti TaxID=53468 RepID=A0A5K3FQ29_MESCO
MDNRVKDPQVPAEVVTAVHPMSHTLGPSTQPMRLHTLSAAVWPGTDLGSAAGARAAPAPYTRGFQFHRVLDLVNPQTQRLWLMGTKQREDAEWQMHYLGDKECCHVWEQLLLMLPQSVTLVSLSGTMPNVVELEDWLSRSRGKTEIQVCQTLKRLVPLQHYFYTGRNKQTSSNFYLIVKKEVKCGWIGQCDRTAVLAGGWCEMDANMPSRVYACGCGNNGGIGECLDR